MQQRKKVRVLCLAVLLVPLVAFATEKEKSFAEKVGETTGDVQTGAVEGYEATKKFVSDGSGSLVEKSKNVYQNTKDGAKKFWDDVKKGYKEATE